jgi:hypothetical protein
LIRLPGRAARDQFVRALPRPTCLIVGKSSVAVVDIIAREQEEHQWNGGRGRRRTLQEPVIGGAAGERFLPDLGNDASK